VDIFIRDVKSRANDKAPNFRYHFLIIVLFFASLLLGQNVTINEYMSTNSSTIYDEDGDTPDWIELYNSGANAINLNGYGITDNPSNPFKWVFPDIEISSQGHLLLFASGKDRQEWVPHWETIIDWGDNWNYFLGNNEPPDNWNQQNFDDAGWLNGPSGFGYGDEDDATEVDPVMSLYVRHEFIVNNIESLLKIVIHVDYDDAFVAYINGEEIARANIGTPGVPPPYNQGADSWREAEMYQGGAPDEYMIDSVQSLLQNGSNVIAIQVHNFNIESSDLTLIPFLTLGMASAPENAVGLSEDLDISDVLLHTNFKILSTGETLMLSNSVGTVVDSIYSEVMSSDISRGRQPDGDPAWLFFGEPTPGSGNITTGFLGVMEPPTVSQVGDPFSNPGYITFESNIPDAVLYYTLDGSFPDTTSTLYTDPIYVASNTVIRAVATKPGWLNSKPITHSYLFDYDGILPIVSLSTNPEHFWDNDSGIYVMGPNASTDFPYFGANFWQDWERPIHIEMFEPNGELGFSIDGGVKIYGAYSRANPQKSLSIFARGMYGYPEINYQVFPDKNIDQFEAIVLRNSGNDWNTSHFRDGLVSKIASQADVSAQAYRPAVVYLNGVYWGILNIREKINEHFLASHFAIDPENIDLLEDNNEVIHGDASHYLDLLNFIDENEISDPETYSVISNTMNIDNYIRYTITQIFVDNWDWPGNNIKYWRPRTPEGYWRWILFDADFAFGLFTPNGYTHDMFEFATLPDGPSATIWGWDPWWPNPPWSTYLLRTLLDNESFRNNFINQFADLLNTTFEPDEILNTVDEITDLLADEMPDHTARWGSNVSTWNNNVDILRNFVFYRNAFVWSHMQSHFNLTGTYQIFLNQSGGGGSINVNSISINDFPWQGQYCDLIPIQIKAVPDPGYRFVEWFGLDSTSSTLIVNVDDDTTFTAIYEPVDGDSTAIVINEINYNSAFVFDVQDWVELANNTGFTIDLSGWQFKDSDDSHVFVIPEQTILENGEFIVLAEDTTIFNNYFPDAGNVVGNLNFGLSGGGELIRLYNPNGDLIDQVTYDDDDPWPIEADGEGPTLELINPNEDNALPINWSASDGYGSPGGINTSYLSNLEQAWNPVEFKVYNNYPNPFNPITTLSYDLPENSFVNITIYNLLGREVRTLVNQNQDAGFKSVIWNGSNSFGKPVSAGVYIYQIRAGKYVHTNKMLLLK